MRSGFSLFGGRDSLDAVGGRIQSRMHDGILWGIVFWAYWYLVQFPRRVEYPTKGWANTFHFTAGADFHDGRAGI